MVTKKIQGKTIKLYDSIDEMPIVNFQKYNKYLLIDAGIGADAEAVDSHIMNAIKYIQLGDTKKAILELQNMQTSIYLVNNQVSPKHLAFASLIHSIDGKEVEDYSEENLKRILETLNKEKHSFLLEVFEQIKKKIEEELKLYFPSLFESAKEKEAYSKFKARTILKLQGIANGENNADQIKEIDTYLLGLHKPQAFVGKESAEIKYDKQFESLCVYVAQKTSQDAKLMTVLQFYTTITIIEKQMEEEKKAYKRH